MRKAETDLQALQEGSSADEIMKKSEAKERIEDQISTLKAALDTASKDLKASQDEVSSLEADPSKAALLAETKKKLNNELAKARPFLEQLKTAYAQKLEIAEEEANQASLNLNSVRERWRQAKDVVTDTQAEVERCQSQISKLQESATEPASPKKRSSSETTGPMDKRQKQG